MSVLLDYCDENARKIEASSGGNYNAVLNYDNDTMTKAKHRSSPRAALFKSKIVYSQ